MKDKGAIPQASQSLKQSRQDRKGQPQRMVLTVMDMTDISSLWNAIDIYVFRKSKRKLVLKRVRSLRVYRNYPTH